MTTKKKPLKQSETITIKRSDIKLNPLNPKAHSVEKVKQQRKNLQKVGYLGGVTWNRSTGNLVDGHRRIQAMDAYYGYNGEPESDYEIKVESIELSEKEEKEQMTYMALGNTKADYSLVAEYIGDIDYKDIGLSEDDLNSILAFADSGSSFVVDDFIPLDNRGEIEPEEDLVDESYNTISDNVEDQESKKKHMKDVKASVAMRAAERFLDDEAYLTISFSNHASKEIFCELLGINPYTSKFVKGEDVLRLIE